MVGWILRVIGIIGLVVMGNLMVAALCIIALVVASTLEEDGFWRWIFGTVVIFIGIWVLMKVHFILGIIAFVVCLLVALQPEPA